MWTHLCLACARLGRRLGSTGRRRPEPRQEPPRIQQLLLQCGGRRPAAVLQQELLDVGSGWLLLPAVAGPRHPLHPLWEGQLAAHRHHPTRRLLPYLRGHGIRLMVEHLLRLRRLQQVLLRRLQEVLLRLHRALERC